MAGMRGESNKVQRPDIVGLEGELERIGVGREIFALVVPVDRLGENEGRSEIHELGFVLRPFLTRNQHEPTRKNVQKRMISLHTIT